MHVNSETRTQQHQEVRYRVLRLPACMHGPGDRLLDDANAQQQHMMTMLATQESEGRIGTTYHCKVCTTPHSGPRCDPRVQPHLSGPERSQTQCANCVSSSPDSRNGWLAIADRVLSLSHMLLRI